MALTILRTSSVKQLFSTTTKAEFMARSCTLSVDIVSAGGTANLSREGERARERERARARARERASERDYEKLSKHRLAVSLSRTRLLLLVGD